MKIATLLRSILTTAVLAVLATAPVRAATVAEPITGYAGNINAFPEGSSVKAKTGGTINVATIVYDNTVSAANFGFSSTDLASVWGDELVLLSGGLVTDHKFTLFNGGSSLGPVLTADVQVSFFDAVTTAFLGAYNVSVNFGAGLNPGFFSTVTVTGIGALLINLPNDIIVTQTVASFSGTATRLGIASRNPPTVGASPATMYISSTTVGPAGFYTVSGLPSNPGYQVTIDLTPVPTRSSTWGSIKKLYR